MTEPTLKKTHDLLEKLTDFVMTKVSTKEEVDHKITQVDVKIDKLAGYVMNNVPTKQEMNARFEQVDRRFDRVDQHFVQVEQRLDHVESDVQETKRDVKLILDGMDTQVKENEILKTEQLAIKSGLGRVEKRVDVPEKKAG